MSRYLLIFVDTLISNVKQDFTLVSWRWVKNIQQLIYVNVKDNLFCA